MADIFYAHDSEWYLARLNNVVEPNPQAPWYRSNLSNDFDEAVLDVAEIMQHITYPKRVVRPRQVPAPEDESF